MTDFRQWRLAGVWLRLHGRRRRLCRRRAGRSAQPTAAIIDSQSAKTTSRGGAHGYDGGKKVNGRKRHLLVDSSGLVLCAQVHAADIADRDGACPLLAAAAARFAKRKHLWADAGYRGQLVAWIKEHLGWSVEVVLPPRRRGRYPEGVRATAHACFHGAQATLGGQAPLRLAGQLPAVEQRLRVPAGHRGKLHLSGHEQTDAAPTLPTGQTMIKTHFPDAL